MIRIRGAAMWCGAVAVTALCLALVAPALAQAPKAAPPEAGQGPKINPPDSGPKRGDRGGPLELVVNGAVQKAWPDAELRRFAATLTTPRWTNRDKEEVLTIPLWTFLKEGGVSREAAQKVQFHSRSRVLGKFEGKELDKLDQLVLRTGDTQNRPWKVSSQDPKNRNPFGRSVVRKIEVTTSAAK